MMAAGAMGLLLLQAAVVTPATPEVKPAKPADPFGALRSSVVEAIRDCKTSKGETIEVCSPDRGFAEKERNRVRKLVKPKPVDEGHGITIQVTAGDGTTPPPAKP
jgi:hypothetical protein